jgi:hypothetical protein
LFFAVPIRVSERPVGYSCFSRLKGIFGGGKMTLYTS